MSYLRMPVSAPTDSIYDGYANSDYASGLAPILGFQIINSTSMTVYSSYYYPDYNYAALSDATLGPVLGNRLPGGSMMPWELYQAMANVVSSGKAAWSTSAATAKSIDWLNLVSPIDIGYISPQTHHSIQRVFRSTSVDATTESDWGEHDYC